MLADAIASLGSALYAVTRRSASVVGSNGKAVAPNASTLQVEGMVQPLSGREVDRLPEGLQAREVRAFWTLATLQAPDQDAGTLGDHIVFEGLAWEVVGQDNWQLLGNYNRYLISRVEP